MDPLAQHMSDSLNMLHKAMEPITQVTQKQEYAKERMAEFEAASKAFDDAIQNNSSTFAREKLVEFKAALKVVESAIREVMSAKTQEAEEAQSAAIAESVSGMSAALARGPIAADGGAA